VESGDAIAEVHEMIHALSMSNFSIVRTGFTGATALEVTPDGWARIVRLPASLRGAPTRVSACSER
jgi:hypothetical protein